MADGVRLPQLVIAPRVIHAFGPSPGMAPSPKLEDVCRRTEDRGAHVQTRASGGMCGLQLHLRILHSPGPSPSLARSVCPPPH
jgi:hypothetical protein